MRRPMPPLAIALLLALPGCGLSIPAGDLGPGAGGPASLQARSAGDGGPAWSTCEAQLYTDAPEIFPAMETMVAQATSSIQVDYYIVSGQEGEKLARILADRARAGVNVQVELDPGLGYVPMISDSGHQVVSMLEQAGVHVVSYPDARRRAEVGGHAIDHDKVLVVDGRTAMLGGMNVADVFMKNHDYMVQLEGPVVPEISGDLAQDFAAGSPFQAQALDADTCQVRLLTTGFGRTYNKQAVLSAIEGAQHSVHVEMFQLTDADVVDALVAAKARGVDVEVLLDPGDIGVFVPVIHWAPEGYPNLPAASVLAHDGVPVRWDHLAPGQAEWHAKTACIDGHLLFVGSTNWTPGGFQRNNETSVEMNGGSCPGKWEAQFASDWQTRSDPVKPIDGSLYQQFKAWLITQFAP